MGNRGRQWAKLDQLLGNLQYIQQFTLANFEYLSRKSSNHKYMVIQCVPIPHNYGPIPFKYHNMWNSHDSFLPLIKHVWEESAQGSGLLKLALKHMHTKLAMRAWNKFFFGRVDQKIMELKDRVGCLEERLQSSVD